MSAEQATTINLIKNITVPEDLSWDFFNTIIQSQSNLAMMGITAVIGIAVLLAGASWLYNFVISKRELKSEIDNIKKSLKEEVQTIRKEVQTIREEMSTSIKDEMKKVEENTKDVIDKELTLINAESARVFAVVSENMNRWENAVDWWISAIKGYVDAKSEDMLRISVDALNSDLGKVELLDDEKIEDIKNCLSYIPDILNMERKEIKDKLENLKQKKQAQGNLDLEQPQH